MCFNYSKLRGRIKEICGTQKRFADCMGLSNPTISKKLNGEVEFTQAEINKACHVLELNPVDIPVYFFTAKV